MSHDAEAGAPDKLAPEQEAPPSDGPRARAACPYLLASNGRWRSTAPVRDHRCAAVAPPAPLALEKQRRLCLTDGHVGCATYLAAQEARRSRGVAPDGQTAIRWGVTRTTPVVDVGVGLGASLASLIAERRAWQAVPAVVLVVALGAIGLSGWGRDLPASGTLPSGSAVPSARPTPPTAPTPSPTPGSSATPAATEAASPTPTEAVTPAPTPTLEASPQTTYTVKSGDTLYAIALKYGTTVSAIMQLNGLTSSVLHVGQVLRIP